ncbi:MAG: hypothetical protein KOO63_15900, partial [Bacteroidales bacterium]|nr:hypothetical protein [Candidatus Latescibacterota bacterium]
FFDNLPARDKYMHLLSWGEGCQADYSHVDMLFGQNGAEEVYQPIAEWLKSHPLSKPRRKTAANKNE